MTPTRIGSKGMLCLPALYVERVNVIEGPCGGPVPLRDAWTGFCHSATTQRCHCSRSCQFAVNYFVCTYTHTVHNLSNQTRQDCYRSHHTDLIGISFVTHPRPLDTMTMGVGHGFPRFRRGRCGKLVLFPRLDRHCSVCSVAQLLSRPVDGA